MTGRPRNPNKPPALKGVRLTERAYEKMLDMHIVGEPFGNTIERAIDEAKLYRKKVRALQGQVEGLEQDVRSEIGKNANLLKIQHMQAETITKLEQLR